MMELFLLFNDMMNSPQSISQSESGKSVFRYGPFGTDKSVSTLVSAPGFNGQRRDLVSGSYHLGNGYRAYNPALMRFNCPDNLSPFSSGGINPYAYCLGDPINRADPTGHISWQAGLGIGLGILGILATAGAAALAISAAGGIGAALSAASGSALLTGGAGVVADVVGIASGAVADTNPELSATLGWVSMGAGLLGVGGGALKLINSTKSKSKVYGISKGETSLHSVPKRKKLARLSAKKEAENFNRLLTENLSKRESLTDLITKNGVSSSEGPKLYRSLLSLDTSDETLFEIIDSQVNAINARLRNQTSTRHQYLSFDGAKVHVSKTPPLPFRNARESIDFSSGNIGGYEYYEPDFI